MLQNIAVRAGLNGNGKYGVLTAHGLRKFFVTQLTNHGVQDRIVDFFIGHKTPEVDRVYWIRRVEELRKIYAERERCLNPAGEPQFDLEKLEGLKAKIEGFERRIKALEESKTNSNCDVKIVTSEEELVSLTKLGYNCQTIGPNRWLMKQI